jgi:hypothetical protein
LRTVRGVAYTPPRMIASNVRSSSPCRAFSSLSLPLIIGVALASAGGCDPSPEPEAIEEVEPQVGTSAHGLDSDSDGMADDWETTYFGNLTRNGTGDYDSDGMTDLEEYTYSFNPTVDDGLADQDGDRYPNVFELRRGSVPTSTTSIPTANMTVDVNGSGNYTNINAAISAATTANGTYQVIAVLPGTYSGTTNTTFTIASTKPKLLIIGTQGASKTIISGDATNVGWILSNTAVVASFTFTNINRALQVNASGKEVRLVDLVLRNNPGGSWTGGIYVVAISKLYITGCTLLENTTQTASAHQLQLAAGTTYLTNTVIYGSASGTHLFKATGATLNATYSLAKGYTLSGTGNLSSSTDPKLRFDAHLRYDSPLIGAGGTVAQSKRDMDLDTRPGSSPDISADQWADSDADQLADFWENEQAGNLTTLTSRTQDADSDGLTNDEEYVLATLATTADTDGDGVSDGLEVNTYGTSPLDTDTDDDEMPDNFEIANSLSATTPNAFEDADRDRYPNVFEYVKSTDPQSATSIPSADFIVDPVLGGSSGTDNIYEKVQQAVNVTASSGYQILAIKAGVYSGTQNTNITIATANKAKLLVIGVDGAAKTIIDGLETETGWTVSNAVVLESLTFDRLDVRSVYVNATSKEVRLVDLLVRRGTGSNYAGGLHIFASGKVDVIGCTFLSNTTETALAEQLYLGSGAVSLTNTVVSSTTSATLLYKHTNATLTANYSFVKGQTLSGSGNLAGTVDPRIRLDGRQLGTSPLRGAGNALAASKFDLDLETRSTASWDIGADQWTDTDGDTLPDAWEVLETGGLTALAGQDADGDTLTDLAEYEWFDGEYGPDPQVADTDADLVPDGYEILFGTNPIIPDADDLELDYDQDGLIECSLDV